VYKTFKVFIAFMASLVLVLSACGDSAEESGSGVATLENSGSTTSAPGAAAPTSEQTRAQEEINELKLLEFSACIRGEGIAGFPDVKVDSDGAIDFAALVSTGIDFQSQDFLDARRVCDPLLEGIQLGANAAPDFEAINETLFEFTECLRDQGLDVGDFQLGQLVGQLQQVPPNSTREEAIAFLLGVTIDDPGVPEAIDICEPLLATLPGQGTNG
jgi:hypothetical protein